MNPEIVLLALFAFSCAGVIKGTVGIGLPTVTISIMAQMVDPRIPIALLLIPALITNSWQVIRGGEVLRSLRTLWPFAVALAVTIGIVVQFAALAETETLVLGIGIVVVLWTLSSLIGAPAQIDDRYDRIAQFIAGGLSGLIGGLTAIWSPPMVMYLLMRRVEKDEFVRCTGFLILAGTLPLLLGYISAGLLTRELAMWSCLMLIPTLTGFTVGEQIRKRISADNFQKAVLILFFLMGLNLIRKSLL